MNRCRSRRVTVAGAAALIAAALLLPMRDAGAQGPVPFVNHVIIIYLENWSLDGMFGLFPGADGLANAGPTIPQTQLNGQPYETLPETDPRIPAGLPVQPFDLAPYIPPTDLTASPESGFYQMLYQIHGGKMDRFLAWTGAGGLCMSYYDATDQPLGLLASRFTLCDHCFHSALGQSLLNAMWLISAATPVFPNAPDRLVAKFDRYGNLLNVKDYRVTPDGYAVGDLDPVTRPYSPKKPAEERVPLQYYPTIGDRLSERGVSWAWYAEGWNAALAGQDNVLSYHHQSFNYFANYTIGTPGRAHLKDADEFLAGLRAGNLPAVSFVKPAKAHDMHPGRSFLDGQQYAADLVQAVQRSRVWGDCAIFITFDESGGRWDHVPPRILDRWGPGLRIPTLVISPFARRGFVDHTQYETVSILKFIEQQWGLHPLTARDAGAPNIVRPFVR